MTAKLPPLPTTAATDHVRTLLLAWWDEGHRDLPWRRTRDPYAILVSEVMLQQTQVMRVVPKYVAFIERFPTLAALAGATAADVIRAWSGLGYNRRAVNLHRLARVVVDEHGGQVPSTARALRPLPGIGEYTARAVASIAFDEPVAAVDTNVRRVLTRVYDGPDSARSPSAVQALADSALAVDRPGDWNQALMELGARVCLPVPDCPSCPLRGSCVTSPKAAHIREQRAAYRVASSSQPAQRYEHSTRFYRGRIVDMLRAEPGGGPLTEDQIGRRLRLDYAEPDRAWLEGLLDGLVRDHLVSFADGRVSLPD
ncbi:MAG: A/G-specific adenine glycosylase [Dehalococcoidia bacterium]